MSLGNADCGVVPCLLRAAAVLHRGPAAVHLAVRLGGDPRCGPVDLRGRRHGGVGAHHQADGAVLLPAGLRAATHRRTGAGQPALRGGGRAVLCVLSLAAVKNDLTLIGAAIGPYHQFGPNDGPGPPSGANLELAEDLGKYVNSFLWKGDPLR